MIDLLPYRQRRIVARIRVLRIVFAGLIGLMVLCLVSILLLLPSYIVVRANLRAADAYTKELEAAHMITSDADIAALDARAKVLREKLTMRAMPSVVMYMHLVQSHVVAGITLTGFEMQNPEKRILQIHGRATTRAALQNFVSQLQDDQTIATVDSPIANFVKSTESDFIVTITFAQL